MIHTYSANIDIYKNYVIEKTIQYNGTTKQSLVQQKVKNLKI